MSDTPPPADPSATVAHAATRPAEPGAGDDPLGSVRYVGDYELLAELARGGMGVVFRARQVSLDRPVAVKMILAGAFAGPSAVGRFRFEAAAAANLDHPNVLPVYEVGESEGHHYYSMKLVAGGTLADRLRADPRPPVRDLVRLLSAVCRAVHFAHQRGVLHRDLKPANILLDADGVPYVADFGLAVAAGEGGDRTGTGVAVGTPEYMPPEQARGEKGLTVGADVYALGAILYEVVAGRPPFRGATLLDTLRRVQELDPEPPRAVNPAASADLETVALRCLAKTPGGRYGSAAELADELDRWLAGDPVVARPPGLVRRAERWARRNPAQLILGLAAGFGMVLAAVVRFGAGETSGPVLAVTVGAGAAFIAWMTVTVRSAVHALEARLTGLPPAAGPPAPAVSGSPAALTPGAAARAAGAGAWRGLAVGLGAVAAWGLGAPPLPNSPGGSDALLAAAVGLLAGALGVLAVRACGRPQDPGHWGVAAVAAALVVAVGAHDWGVARALLDRREGWFFAVAIPVLPLAAVYWDWTTRYTARVARRTAAAGNLTPERLRLIEAQVSHAVAANTPSVVLVLAAVVGHELAAALARAGGATPAAAEAARLDGRLAGVLGGVAAAAALLHRRRPAGGADRYPTGVAALYVLLAVVLVAVYFRH